MKARRFVMLMASVGLVFGLMTGCGGGGDDDAPATTPTVGLEADKVNDFVGDISVELGCIYTELATAQSKQLNTTISLDTVGLIKKVIVSGKNVKDMLAAPIISATEPGTCGGSITIPDDLLSTMTGTITFDNYCMSAEEIGSQTTINGSVTLAGDEAAGTITASTPTPLTIVSSSPATDNPVNVTIDLDSATLTINEDESIDITITALTVTDHTAGDVYTITNFTANMSGDMITFSGTFDPGTDAGALSVVGSINGTTGVGTITATDQNGVTVTISSTDLEGAIFDVSFDGAPLGTMDCSDVTVPELPAV